MEHPKLTMLKSKYPKKEYPSNAFQPWTNEEERILLEELNNTDIELIAKNHNRTIGGIKSRLKLIAYNMYINKTPIEEIILKTKIKEPEMLKIVKNRQTNFKTRIQILENENTEMKKIIGELQNMISQLVKHL
jgi:hypothetical protein